MMEGKVIAATLRQPETVRESLLKKHPPGKPFVPSAIVSENVSAEPYPVIFDVFFEYLIRNTVIKREGSAGPSDLGPSDSAAWRRSEHHSNKHY